MIKKLLNYKLPLTLIFIASFLVLLRVIFFAASYGSVEHDSGWYIGVAKNLAQEGEYASFTNTIAVEGKGAFPSLHGRYSVQDKEGHSFFPGGVTVGPGFVVPEALVIKIFGSGWWQYRTWSLIAFFALVFLFLSVAFFSGGFVAAFVMFMFLWALPQLTIQFAYEAFSEHTALLFLVSSFVMFFLGKKTMKNKYFLFAGILLSFSFLTKNLYLLPGLAYFFLFVYFLISNPKKGIVGFLFFLLAFLFPILIYEGYRYLALVSNFGVTGWQAINKDLEIVFKSSGSGLSDFSISKINWSFVQEKLKIWKTIGAHNSIIFWFAILFSVGALFKTIKGSFPKFLFRAILFSFLISFTWFIFISPTGWGRHIWQGVVMGLLLIALSIGALLKKPLNFRKTLAAIFLGLVIILNIDFTSLNFNFFLDQKDIDSWRIKRYEYSLQGFPSTPILSFKDQKGLVNYFEKNIKKEDRIYYLGWFINAESAAITNKVFFSLDRYFNLGQKNPNGGRSFIIIGPYQQGDWSLMPDDYARTKKRLLCREIVFENPSYSLCTIKENIVYNNTPYY